MHRVMLLQPAFILHARLYRDTSLLLDVFTQDQGRVPLIARGVRSKNNKIGRILQPFSLLLLSWQGRTELMNLTHAEWHERPYALQGEALLCGFYINEVLVRVLDRGDPAPRLFQIYASTLQHLSQASYFAPILRLFEKHLLAELGYALPLDQACDGNPLSPQKKYLFTPQVGFQSCASENTHGFSGAHLLALRAEQLQEKAVLKEIKRLMQLALSPLLGEKPLKSRSLILV